MTALQMTAVLIRLFAIWCGIDSLSWLISFLDPSQHRSYGSGLALAYTALYAGAGAVLWAFPSLIARRLLVSEASGISHPAEPMLMLNVAVVAIGLLVLALSIPNILGAVATFVEVGMLEPPLQRERISLLLRVAATVLHPLFGLVLVLKARSVTALLWPRIKKGSDPDA